MQPVCVSSTQSPRRRYFHFFKCLIWHNKPPLWLDALAEAATHPQTYLTWDGRQQRKSSRTGSPCGVQRQVMMTSLNGWLLYLHPRYRFAAFPHCCGTNTSRKSSSWHYKDWMLLRRGRRSWRTRSRCQQKFLVFNLLTPVLTGPTPKGAEIYCDLHHVVHPASFTTNIYQVVKRAVALLICWRSVKGKSVWTTLERFDPRSMASTLNMITTWSCDQIPPSVCCENASFSCSPREDQSPDWFFASRLTVMSLVGADDAVEAFDCSGQSLHLFLFVFLTEGWL